MARPVDVAVVGGGVIGMATAWRARAQGLGVCVIDPSPGRGSTWAAAGLLAPAGEVHYGEEELLALNIESARRYPSFVAEVEDTSGIKVGYRRIGSLMVAFDQGDAAVLAELHKFQGSLGLDSSWVSGKACREMEPMLAPGVRAGLAVPGDHQVDNRLLAAALEQGLTALGVALLRQRAAKVVSDAGRVTGVLVTDGTTIEAATVVLAAGCWSASALGLPPEAVPPTRPVKGQILRLRGPQGSPLLSRNLIGVVNGSRVYLGPRESGQVVVGATVEEKGFDDRVVAGAVYELLRDATRIVPGVAELELEEAHAGLRPGSPDNAPILGPPPGTEGLVVATGHYRNGVLLAPLTADLVVKYLSSGEVPRLMRPFSPARFAPASRR